MFKYSCYIENSKEAREWLEMIGWKEKYVQDDSDIIVCASNTGLYSVIVEQTQDWFKEYSVKCIDCTNNLPLFKALTAVRDDSDYMQWFTDGYHFEVCPELKADITAWHNRYKTYPHKATDKELIEYFKKK